MKLVYLCGAALLFFFAVEAHADRVDVIENMTDVDYCSVVADQFHAGATSQMTGFARRLTQLTPTVVEMLEHGIPIPRDAMYVPQYNELTDREKKWMETNVLIGYDEAAKHKDLTEEALDKMTQTYFEGCMYKRTAQKRSEIFIHAASSEKLIDEQFCKDRLFDINRIVSAIRHRPPISQNHVEQVARHSPELGPDRLATILLMIDEAYNYTGDLTEWMKSRAKDCM